MWEVQIPDEPPVLWKSNDKEKNYIIVFLFFFVTFHNIREVISVLQGNIKSIKHSKFVSTLSVLKVNIILE